MGYRLKAKFVVLQFIAMALLCPREASALTVTTDRASTEFVDAPYDAGTSSRLKMQNGVGLDAEEENSPSFGLTWARRGASVLVGVTLALAAAVGVAFPLCQGDSDGWCVIVLPIYMSPLAAGLLAAPAVFVTGALFGQDGSILWSWVAGAIGAAASFLWLNLSMVLAAAVIPDSVLPFAASMSLLGTVMASVAALYGYEYVPKQEEPSEPSKSGWALRLVPLTSRGERGAVVGLSFGF